MSLLCIVWVYLVYVANTILHTYIVKDELKAELQSRQIQVHDLEQQLQHLQQLLKEVS